MSRARHARLCITRAKGEQVQRALTVLALALAACEGPPARAKPWRHERDPAPPSLPDAGAEQRAARAEREGTLSFRLAAEPATLNPIGEPDRETLQVMEDAVLETLVRHERAGYVPRLAESFRVVGGLEIRFVLRKGVTFHGGRPFTAADARASLEAARRRSPRLRAGLADVAGVEVWGPRDLRVVLRRENAYVLRAIAEAPILPAGELAARVPSGTGPYHVAGWRHGEEILLERNPAYWGQPPAIERISFRVVNDGAEALALLKRGELDVLPSLIPEHWPEQANAPDVAGAFSPLELAPPRLLAVVLNLRRPPFDDPRVRRAAAMLVDRGRLARETWRGLARPVAGPVWPGGPGDGDAPPPPPYDPVRAMLLLDEAGWRLERDGVRARDGQKLRVVFLGVGDGADPERDLIVSGLKRGGFGVEVRPVESAGFVEALRAGDLDAAVLDYRGRVDEDLAPLLATGGAKNFGGLSSPAIDAMCLALQRAWEPAARPALAAQLAALIAAEGPFVPLVAPDPHGLIARRVSGVVVHDGLLVLRHLSLAR
jgi:peptide/nickel transport system substrate-binding protein